MSLTTWFRDYVYIPLGGNKRGLVRTCLNTAVVFLFVGAWHGANWTFIFWGAWFTLFLILERLFPLPDTKRSRPLQRAYVLLVVLIGWILFRSSTLSDALQRLMVIATFAGGTEAADVRIFVSPFVLLVFACALMIATPLPQQMLLQARQNISPGRLEILSFIYHAVLLVFAMLVVAASAYRPFIYFQF